MRRALTISSLVVGLTLLTIALLAPPASGTAAQERLLRLNLNHTDINYLDPALNYDFYGWRLEAATCAMLLSYPDKAGRASARLEPEVSAGFPRVSSGGKTYTFTVKSGFRFSDGTPVTPASFARAIERALDPKMQSPAATFLSDVVGAGKVLAGKATRPSGVKVKGNTLTISLTRVAPDFLSRLAMPFFCSVPANLPIDPKGVNTLPGAGPYYFDSKEPGRLIVLKQNPYYKGRRKQNWDEIRVTANVDQNASYLQVRKGEADLDMISLPASAHSALTKEFGINKSRYFVYPGASIAYFALNTSRGIFKDPKARQAVNFAIDRPALIRLSGANAGTPNDQILPPGIPGYRDASIYPLERPNVERAKKLLGGRTGTVVLYTTNDTRAQNEAQILQANLKAIGLDLEVKQFAFATLLDKAGTRGEPFDMESIAWFADYPDPYDFVNILLYGETLTQNHNINTSYFDDPAYNRKMEAAARLSGDERFRAYGKLDIDIMRNAAPLAVIFNQNTREFISDKVGCPTWTFAWGGLNLVLLCPKK
jgi:ABC-type oligopeptide transport system substrate-binding subunit